MKYTDRVSFANKVSFCEFFSARNHSVNFLLQIYNSSSIKLGDIEKFCLPGMFLGWRVLTHFNLKTRQEILIKFIKFLSYNKFSCIVFCAKMSEYLQYILFTKRIEAFWSRDISSIGYIRTF